MSTFFLVMGAITLIFGKSEGTAGVLVQGFIVIFCFLAAGVFHVLGANHG